MCATLMRKRIFQRPGILQHMFHQNSSKIRGLSAKLQPGGTELPSSRQASDRHLASLARPTCSPHAFSVAGADVRRADRSLNPCSTESLRYFVHRLHEGTHHEGLLEQWRPAAATRSYQACPGLVSLRWRAWLRSGALHRRPAPDATASLLGHCRTHSYFLRCTCQHKCRELSGESSAREQPADCAPFQEVLLLLLVSGAEAFLACSSAKCSGRAHWNELVGAPERRELSILRVSSDIWLGGGRNAFFHFGVQSMPLRIVLLSPGREGGSWALGTSANLQWSVVVFCLASHPSRSISRTCLVLCCVVWCCFILFCVEGGPGLARACPPRAGRARPHPLWLRSGRCSRRARASGRRPCVPPAVFPTHAAMAG